MRILNLTREEDVIERYKEFKLEDIREYCFYYDSLRNIAHNDIAIMEENGFYKVFKTRYDVFERETIYSRESFLNGLDTIFIQEKFVK